MKASNWYLFPLTVSLLFVSCTKATFRGASPGSAAKDAAAQPQDSSPPESNVAPAPQTPIQPPVEAKVEPEKPTIPGLPACQPGQLKTGTHIAFLIDNSNSNAATDCPGSKKLGSFGGADTYECAAQTSREKAVLAVFDLLKDFSGNEPATSLATSKIAISSFPTTADFVSGYKIESPFVLAQSDTRSQIESALNFTRKPFGLTPYLAALNSAEEMMTTAGQDQRSKVVIMVTDGEPTDRGPKAVATKAESLKASGIKVITVYYNGGMTRAERNGAHFGMMSRFEEAFTTRPEKHWFDQGQFGSFDSYATYLLGNADNPSLLARMTSQEEASCQDTAGKLCARKSYEVSNAEGLKKVFLEIVSTQALGCGS